MKHKNRIYLVLEVKQREIDSRIIFSLKAANLGYSVVFCKKAYLEQKIKYFQKGVIILKSIGTKNHNFILKAKKYGHKICSFDEEGLLFHNPEYYCKKRIPEKCLSELDLFFSWGEHDKNAIIKLYPNYHEKIKEVGNCRIELLKYPLNEIYKNQGNEIKKRYGKFVLVNTKFGYAGFTPAEKKFNIVDSFIKVLAIDETEKKFHQYILESQVKRRDDLINLFLIFEKKNNDIKFLVRPHQSEKITFWNEIENKLKNVKIIRDGQHSLAWMCAAQSIISFNCTTAIEGKFFNKNHLNYVPLDKNDFKIPNNINKNIYDIIELEKELVKDFYEEQHDDSSFNLDLSKNIKNIKTDFVNNVCVHLDLLFKNFKINKTDKYTNIISFGYFIFKRFLINFYYLRVRGSYSESKTMLSAQKNPKTDLKEVKDKSKIFMKYLDIKDIKVEEIYPNVFCFEKNDFKK